MLKIRLAVAPAAATLASLHAQVTTAAVPRADIAS
jgi:hypothetical protein